jgi:hypothetical protein
MNRRKQFRAVATRYDKLACRYRATVRIADILIWLRAKPDRRHSLSPGAGRHRRDARDRVHLRITTPTSCARADAGRSPEYRR